MKQLIHPTDVQPHVSTCCAAEPCSSPSGACVLRHSNAHYAKQVLLNGTFPLSSHMAGIYRPRLLALAEVIFLLLFPFGL